MLKSFLLAATLVATGAAYAADSTPAPAAADQSTDTPANPKFAQVQKRLLARIDRSIANLEDVRDCVASATDMASLKACKPEQGNKGKGDDSGDTK